MNRTAIQWTDFSWPIVNGCMRCSPGCKNCYAEGLEATRLVHLPKYQGLAVMTPGGPRWTGETRLWEPDLYAPLRKHPELARNLRRGPGSRPMVFVADMGDLFYEKVRPLEIARVFAVMRLATGWDFQILTKRQDRLVLLSDPRFLDLVEAAADTIAEELGIENPVAPWPLPNVWVGVSCEDKPRLARLDRLREVPAAVRFVSIEPLLEDLGIVDWRGIDWAIVGGESGRKARPFDVRWARALLARARAAEVAFFLKQLGSKAYTDARDNGRMPGAYEPGAGVLSAIRLRLVDSHGGDPNEWAEDLQVREFPIAA